jgi:hypothetical protein
MAKDVFQHLELVDNIHFLTLTYDNCKKIQVENAQNIDWQWLQKINGDSYNGHCELWESNDVMCITSIAQNNGQQWVTHKSVIRFYELLTLILFTCIYAHISSPGYIYVLHILKGMH